MNDSISAKKGKLEQALTRMERVVVAFSGGVDSSFLTHFASQVIGSQNVLAVTGRSETYTETELQDALNFAQRLHLNHRVIETKEIENEQFAQNSDKRCYYCKQELFSKLSAIAAREDYKYVIDGANIDDLGDYRPGRDAARELKIKSPLIEAGLNKSEIRHLSRDMGLYTWDKPQMACLASRFPYGSPITAGGLLKVSSAESVIRDLGFKEVRVRDHGHVARIEVGKKDIKRLFLALTASEVTIRLKKLGYLYITIDAEGYRTGSMNEVLAK